MTNDNSLNSWYCGVHFCRWLIVATILYIIYIFRQKTSNVKALKGPVSWPIFGNLLQIGAMGHITLNEMRRYYGDVFRVYFGSKLVVVVAGPQAVDECLKKQSLLFSARPNFAGSEYVLQNKSITFSEMESATHRRYRQLAMRAIREVVQGRRKPSTSSEESSSSNQCDFEISYVERILQEEAYILGRILSDISIANNDQERTGSIKSSILLTVCNLNSTILFGKRYERSDPELQDMAKLANDLQATDLYLTLANFMPWIGKLWPFGMYRTAKLNKQFERNIFHRADIHQNSNPGFHEVTNSEVKKPSTVLEFLLQVLNVENTDEVYDSERTLLLLGDLLGAGTDTMNTALAWLIIYIATYQDTQMKVRREVRRFHQDFGRLPSYAERKNVPFLLSFLSEVLRHSSFVPFTIPHAPSSDANLCGFPIAKGTLVLASLWSINRDKKLWHHPDRFMPERFIRDGQFDHSKADQVLVFGSGRRRCAGELLARIELFVFAVAFMDAFKFRRVRGATNFPKSELALSIRPKTIDVITEISSYSCR